MCLLSKTGKKLSIIPAVYNGLAIAHICHLNMKKMSDVIIIPINEYLEVCKTGLFFQLQTWLPESR